MDHYDYSAEPFGLEEYISSLAGYIDQDGKLRQIPEYYAWIGTSYTIAPHFSDRGPPHRTWILAKHKRTGKPVKLFFTDKYAIDTKTGEPWWVNFRVVTRNGTQRVDRKDYEKYCHPSGTERYAKRFLRNQGLKVKQFVCW